MNRDLSHIVQLLAKGPNALFLHSNADLDCTGAASALALHFGNSTLHAPSGISHLGRRLLDSLDVKFVTDPGCPENENIVVLDAHSDSSLGYAGVRWGEATVIDHHSQSGNFPSRRHFVDATATSSCELVWEIIGRPGNLRREIGFALMAGLLADTGHLKRGTPKTLANASEIMQSAGLRLEDMQCAFEAAEDQDVSRRVSRLKGAQRLRFERSGDWIVASTETGAFESAACHALLSIGADVAFAASQKEGCFRITGRANTAAIEAGVRLGDMLDAVASECGGEGGGHDGAAGLTGSGDAEAFLNICTVNALKRLKGKGRP